MLYVVDLYTDILILIGFLWVYYYYYFSLGILLFFSVVDILGILLFMYKL